MKRQILIIGRGNIGTFIGAAFNQNADNNVLHFVRNTSSNPNSVQLNFSDRRNTKNKIKKTSTYYYQQTDRVADIRNSNYIFIPVKYTHWRKVIEDLKTHITPNQIVVLCGNVLDDFEWFEQNIPCPYVFAFPNFGGTIIDGALQGWLTANFTVGITKPNHSSQLQDVSNLLKSVGFNPKIEQDIKGWLMTHFAYNAGMLSEAANQGGFQKMSKSFSGLYKMYKKMRECMDVIKDIGIDTNCFSEGRSVFAPIWWNVLKTYLLFLLPGVAKSADATKDLDEWASYIKKLHLFASKQKTKTD